MQSRDRIIDDQLIHFYEAGSNDSNTNLIFLHGWRSQGTNWLPLIKHLEKYRILLLDLPGFAGSPAPKKPYTLNDYARVVENFIEKKDKKNVMLIGHSFGGRIALKIASKGTKSWLKKLVLINSAGQKPKSKKIKNVIASIVRPIFQFSFLQSLRKKIYRLIGAEDYLATPELTQTFLNIIHEDLTSYLSSIHVPTLIIWGENDKDTPIEWAHTIHDSIKDSQIEILPNAGHFSFLDQPEKTAHVILDFV